MREKNKRLRRRHELLAEVLELAWQSNALVDAPEFRASHVPDRAEVDALVAQGFLARDDDQYRVTILGLDELKTDRARHMLKCGDILAKKLYERFVDPSLRKEHYHVREIADLWNISIAECILMLRHFHDILGSWTSGWTTGLATPDAWVVPGEVVCDYPNTNALIRERKKWKSRAHLHPYPGLQNLDGTKVPVLAARAPQDWYRGLPKVLQVLISEIEESRSRGNKMLSVLGARAALDAMCGEMWGDIGTFDSKLQRLADEGLVGVRQHKLLKYAIEVGNATSHRGHVPTKKDADAVCEIIEGLLKQHYVLSGRASQAAQRVPPKRIKR